MLYDIYVMEDDKAIYKGTYEADNFTEACENMLAEHTEVSPASKVLATGYDK